MVKEFIEKYPELEGLEDLLEEYFETRLAEMLDEDLG